MSLSANALTLSLPENKAVESRLELLLQIELFYAPPTIKMLRLSVLYRLIISTAS